MDYSRVVTKVNLRGVGGLTPPVGGWPSPPAPYLSAGQNVPRDRGLGSVFQSRAQLYHPDSSGSFAPPVFNTGMAFSDIGSSGLRQWSGWVREEFLPQLTGRMAARTYREMLDNSSVCGGLMYAINTSMRKISWRIDPADDSQEAASLAEFFDGCRDDMSSTWPEFIVEMQSMLAYGFSPMEVVYKRCMGRKPPIDVRTGKPMPQSNFDDGMIRWRKIALRGQDTVIKWFFGQDGEITGMTQQPWSGPILDIPIEKLLLFRPTSHKNNPEGRSILRSAYRSWYMAKRIEEMEAILFERMGGVPTLYIPNEIMERAANGDANASAKLSAFKQIATNIRVDEQMGLVLPSDLWEGATGGTGGAGQQFRFELVTPQRGSRGGIDSDKVIQRYNVNILASVMADFLQLGHESRGTQALSQNKTDMFFNALEGFLMSGSETMNRYAIPRLGDLNGMNPDKLPKYVPDMPQRLDLDVLSNFVLRLSQAGMPLFPNPVLEEYLGDAAGWPDISESNSEAHAIVGPAATMEIQDNMPEPPPGQPTRTPGNSPQDKLKKIITASMFRRAIRLAGGTSQTPRRLERSGRRWKEAA
jgi:hypothetical protein